jgi:hypothetical protein
MPKYLRCSSSTAAILDCYRPDSELRDFRQNLEDARWKGPLRLPMI